MNNEKQQFIYVLKLIERLYDDDSWTEEDNNIVKEHFEKLQRLNKEGTVILAGRTLNTDAEGFGIVILEVSSEDEARKLMNSDPAVRDGIMTAKLYPYRVALI